MASFLQLLAKDIIRKYGTDFADLTIIFPNKSINILIIIINIFFIDLKSLIDRDKMRRSK